MDSAARPPQYNTHKDTDPMFYFFVLDKSSKVKFLI
jgi:hypothetical protein